MSSELGKNVRVSIFGQSHATAIGVCVDGLPAGERVDLEELSRFLRALTRRLDNALTRYVQRRVLRAYPTLEGSPRARREKAAVFAQGCGFYKLFWLFFIACLLGDLIETIFCRLTMGE